MVFVARSTSALMEPMPTFMVGAAQGSLIRIVAVVAKAAAATKSIPEAARRRHERRGWEWIFSWRDFVFIDFLPFPIPSENFCPRCKKSFDGHPERSEAEL